MKRILTLLLTVFLSSCAASNEKPAITASPDTASSTSQTVNDEKEIVRLIREWNDVADKRHDTAREDKIVADEYLEINTSGKIRNKAEKLAATKASDYQGDVASFDDMKIRFFGNTAVATFLFSYQGTEKGKPDKGQCRYSTVWVKRNGQWQAVSSHDSCIQ